MSAVAELGIVTGFLDPLVSVLGCKREFSRSAADRVKQTKTLALLQLNRFFSEFSPIRSIFNPGQQLQAPCVRLYLAQKILTVYDRLFV